MTVDDEAFGALAPGWLDRTVIGLTRRLPNNWLGLRLAILFRRAVTMRLDYPAGALDVERWGLKMRLHPRDNGCEKNLLFTPQMYEPTELKELGADIAQAREQQKPFVFVDIGANVGLFSFFVAAYAGAEARVFAIEPEPGNQRRLKFNVGANSALPIKILPIALSDEAGELVVELDRRDRGGSRTRKIVGPQSDSVRVPAQTLLHLLQSERVETVNALKIDVEGFEDVILGPFFRDAPPQILPHLIVIEDCRDSWKADLMSMMADKGYSIAARSKLNFILRLVHAPAGSTR
ncbi:MAG: FkbM family methyltransferase [Xanthobacteraceae bacterium]|jgi:FkbM family methyltransferase